MAQGAATSLVPVAGDNEGIHRHLPAKDHPGQQNDAPVNKKVNLAVWQSCF